MAPLFRRIAQKWGLVDVNSRFARERLAELEKTLQAGREAYVLGVGFAVHNSGAALVRISPDGTLELICNEEEERYTAVKHCSAYPQHSIDAVKRRMSELGIEPTDLAACVSSWDFAKLLMIINRTIAEEAPGSMLRVRNLDLHPGQPIQNDTPSVMRSSASRLARQLGHERRIPVIGIRHHDNHAYGSYALSPFAAEPDPTMVLVLDGSGDDASTSLYEAREGRLTLLAALGSNLFDSLGMIYGVLSSTQGGWPLLSSEGRYMGAAAWGDGNRLTNGYYRRLRQIVYFGAEGEIRLNRALGNWTRAVSSSRTRTS